MTGDSAGAELKVLLGYLNGQRNHVLGILNGLTEEQMRTAALPSGWTPRELVHHLALDDEAFWFRGTVAGEQEVKDAVAADQDGWKVPEHLSGADVIALYREEIEWSRSQSIDGREQAGNRQRRWRARTVSAIAAGGR